MSEKANPQNLKDAAKRIDESLNGNGKSPNPGRQIAQDLESLKDALDTLRQDLSRVAGDAFQTSFKSAREKFKESQDSVKELGREVDKKVHENPWMSLGIVGIFAFLIGFLLGRKD